MNKRLFPILTMSLGSCVLFVNACGKKVDEENSTSQLTIQPQLMRVSAANYTGLRGPVRLNALGATKTTNVSIKSLKYPIGSITVSDAPTGTGTTASAGGNTNFAIYECTGTNNDSCLVELTGDALTNLLANAPSREAKIGTFSQINISPCYQGGKSTDVRVKLTAEATIDGTLYYTNALSGLSTTGPAEEVTFSPNGGCGSVRFLTKDLVIAKDSFVEKERSLDENKTNEEPDDRGQLKDQLDLKLYFDLANAVIAAGPSTASNAKDSRSDSDFCKGAGTQENAFVCINFPEIVATLDSGTPTLTRMLINDSTIWGFYSNSDGIPFGAYQRSYYNGFYSTEPEFLVGPMFERFQVNSDGSVSFQQYDDGQNRHLKVLNFKLSNHSGTMTKGSTTLNYTAEKLP